MATFGGEPLANGIPVLPGEPIPLRKEIRSLSKAEIFVYVEGLALYQQASRKNRTDPLSYYQIAAIHGKPYMGWPNNDSWGEVPARKLKDKNDIGGFCTHTSIIFLTWHRPYLALFEAALYIHVQKAAESVENSDPHKAEYVAAAKHFRMPYWDWSLPHDKGSMFPQLALRNDSLPKDIKFKAASEYNPLYKYVFPPKENLNQAEIDAWDDMTQQGRGETVRHTDGLDMETVLQKYFDEGKTGVKAGQNLTERTAYLLQSYSQFAPFSNNKFNGGIDPTGGAAKYGSLEDLHNIMHVNLGGGGQMGRVPTSGFDPIFWLHHTNIDRLGAIWQGLWQDGRKESWVTKVKAEGSNIVTEAGTYVDVETKLYPFRATDSEWFNSDTMKQTKDFGYYYPETANTTFPLDETEKKALRAKITELYPPPARFLVMSQKGNDTAETMLLEKANIVKVALGESNSDPAPAVEPRKLSDLVGENSTYTEWLVNIKAEKHSLGGNYSVLVFLGPPEDTEPGLWHLSPTYVGGFYPFGQDTDTGCAACRDAQEQHLEVTGQIPLTLALMERYLVDKLENMEKETVINHLKVNLHWRVVRNGANLPDRSEVQGLKVFVVTNKVTLPQNEDELAVYDPDVDTIYEVTTKEESEAGGRAEGTGLTYEYVQSALASAGSA